jgi:branched-chain amino acid transport system permease protein
MGYILALILNGLSLGMVLFLVASGLTLTLGTMRLLNLTHGSFFMVAAYAAFQLQKMGVPIALTWVVAVLAATACGAVVFFLLRLLEGQALRQALLTFGLLFIAADLALVFWGGAPSILGKPEGLGGTWDLGVLEYPSYRLVLILVGIAAAIGLWFFLYRTRAGMELRAVVDNRDMARAVGINPTRVAAGTFIAGAALAGLSGALGGAVLGVYPGIDVEILLFALVIVIVGGAGSVGGALIGSLAIGLVNSFVIAYLPSLAFFSMFAIMLVVLAVRPNGIAGRALA